MTPSTHAALPQAVRPSSTLHSCDRHLQRMLLLIILTHRNAPCLRVYHEWMNSSGRNVIGMDGFTRLCSGVMTCYVLSMLPSHSTSSDVTAVANAALVYTSPWKCRPAMHSSTSTKVVQKVMS